MLRVVLINILLFLLPFAVFAVFVLLRRPGTSHSQIWRDAPLMWLFGIGTALVFTVLIFFASFSGAPKEGTYTPAEIRDGKLVPGHVDRE